MYFLQLQKGLTDLFKGFPGNTYYSDPQNFVVLPFFLSIKGGANFEPPTSVHKKRILAR
jgi:hypothetical protein